MKKTLVILIVAAFCMALMTGCASNNYRTEINGVDGNWCSENPGKCTGAILLGAGAIGWAISEANDDDPAPAPAPQGDGGD